MEHLILRSRLDFNMVTDISAQIFTSTMPEGPMLVTGAIISRNGRILVAQRHENSRFEPNKWEFPGGKVDFSEHPEEALKRELHEELGIEIETGPLYEVLSHVYDKNGNVRHVVLLFYICRIMKGEPMIIDCQDLKWVNREEMNSLSFVEGDLPLVNRILEDAGVWEIDLTS
jgi:8-oxo-dGTP diphosphatase